MIKRSRISLIPRTARARPTRSCANGTARPSARRNESSSAQSTILRRITDRWTRTRWRSLKRNGTRRDARDTTRTTGSRKFLGHMDDMRCIECLSFPV